MTDWQPTSLTPSNGDWDQINHLQLLLQGHPVFYGRIEEQLEAGNTAQLAIAGPGANPSWAGLMGTSSSMEIQSQMVLQEEPSGQPLDGAGSTVDIQQGMVDFVRYVFPGGHFDPASASETFQLGQFLLDVFARLLTFPGGAMLAYSILTSLHRQVPDLGASLRPESDLSQFEALDSRLWKLFRKLLAGFDQVPILSPSWLQNVEAWIQTVNANYQNLEALGIFEEPDFLSRLFRRISDQMDDSLFPGEKAGWAGVVFYVLGLIFQEANPGIAERLFECGDLLFELSSLFNLDGELGHLLDVGSTDGLLPGPLDRFLTISEGVEGLFDYGHAFSDLLDPSLNPYVAGEGVWPRRISVMLSGIKGILSTGSSIVSLSGLETIAVFATPLAAGIIICCLVGWVIDNWDWISVGLRAWRQNWNMLTQVILPYRLHQSWHWFDDNIGRPVREHLLQPIGQWANQAWNGLTGLVQSLAGE